MSGPATTLPGTKAAGLKGTEAGLKVEDEGEEEKDLGSAAPWLMGEPAAAPGRPPGVRCRPPVWRMSQKRGEGAAFGVVVGHECAVHGG